MGSESSTANKNIWSCSRKDLKEHPRGQKRIENILARCLSIFDWAHGQSSTMAGCSSRWCLCTFRGRVGYQIGVRERLLVQVWSLGWDCFSFQPAQLFALALSLHKAFDELLLRYSRMDEGWALSHIQQNFLLPALTLFFVCLIILKFLTVLWSEPKNWNHHWECAARDNYEAKCNHNTLNVDLRDV